MISMLTRAELRVLSALHGPATLKELSGQLGVSRSRLSIIARSLEQKDLIKRQKDGKEILLIPSSSKPLELFHELLTRFPHVDFISLLAGRKLKVIGGMAVEEPRPVWEISLRSNVNRYTVHHVLTELMERLIVGKNERGYFIAERFSLVKEFADEYFRLQNSIKAKSFSHDSVVLWSGVNEFILATGSFKGLAVDSFQLTGLSRFSSYGLGLISSGVYHYYWPSREITLEEVIVHTLAVGVGARELLYVVTILKARGFNAELLRRLAIKFDVLGAVDEIIEYLGGKEKGYPFPSGDEVEELCRQYFGGFGNDNEGKIG